MHPPSFIHISFLMKIPQRLQILKKMQNYHELDEKYDVCYSNQICFLVFTIVIHCCIWDEMCLCVRSKSIYAQNEMTFQGRFHPELYINSYAKEFISYSSLSNISRYSIKAAYRLFSDLKITIQHFLLVIKQFSPLATSMSKRIMDLINSHCKKQKFMYKLQTFSPIDQKEAVMKFF